MCRAVLALKQKLLSANCEENCQSVIIVQQELVPTIQHGIRNYLKQQPNAPILPHSCTTIYRALHELQIIAPRRLRWHEPLILPAPMDEWEIDFGEIFLRDADTVFEFFMVVDRGTSRLIYL